MKMAYEPFSTVLEITPKYVSSLIVEDAKTLYKLLTEIHQASDGYDSTVVFSRNDMPVSAQKEVSLLTDLIGFTMNQKSLITKIIAELDKKAVDEKFYQKTQQICSLLETHVMDMSMDLPCELLCEKMSIQSLLKAVGITIADNYDTLEEKLLGYMDLVRELVGRQVFVLVNSRCLISYEKMQLMVETALMREHEILLIDNKEYPKLDHEKRMIVDMDLCEI